MRSVLRVAVWSIGTVFSLLVAAELSLHFASLFSPLRSVATAGGKEVILCVGDSHTYGAAVGEEEAYPRQLQLRLDEREPGRFAVVNLGVPGMNSFQVANRLAAQIAEYHPVAILVWVGINDTWNVAERDDHGLPGLLVLLAERSKLYKLVAVWRSDRRITDSVRAEVRLERPSEWGVGNETHVRADGERFTSVRDTAADRRDDFPRIAETAKAAGVPIAFLKYPIRVGIIKDVNHAIDTRGRASLDTFPAVERVPVERRNFLWAGHPSAEMYREISKDVAEWVWSHT